MRLIKASTLELVDFLGDDIPEYAILSHTWGQDEVTLECLRSGNYSDKAGYRKIRYTLDQAIEDGLGWAWVDTCCIDKTSSAELSEAINSMFRWYASAKVCYAYLEDVEDGSAGERIAVDSHVAKSRWFTRGWTLQELIAPQNVRFYTQTWKSLATRSETSVALAPVTGIPEDLLARQEPLTSGLIQKYCIAERMCWASGRVTTRPEDRAYSLLGLFEINMPLLYGEGVGAFRRLQEAILSASDDFSILAWDGNEENSGELFARSPNDFRTCGGLMRANLPGGSFIAGETTVTNVSLRMNARVLDRGEFKDFKKTLYIVLPCRPRDDFTKVLALKVLLRPGLEGSEDVKAVEDGIERGLLELGCGPGNKRVTLLDIKTAFSESVERTIAIRKVTLEFHFARWHDFFPTLEVHRSCDYLWFRGSSAFWNSTPTPDIERVYPAEHWNPRNWTFDLTKAREARAKQLSKEDPEKAVRVYGGIQLREPRISIMFRHNTTKSSSSRNIVFNFAEYELGLGIWPHEMPDTHMHVLQRTENSSLTLRLQISLIFGYSVAILDIDLEHKYENGILVRLPRKPQCHT